jgi:hypothetical protein
MLFITVYSLVLAEVVLCSLYSLISVKKDSPSKGVLDSCRVLSSIVLAVSPPVGVSAQVLINRVAVWCQRRGRVPGSQALSN